MGRLLSEQEVPCAELAISRFFEVSGKNEVLAASVIEYAKESGLHRAEMKEARKRLGVKSQNVEGVFWWFWPEASNPDEVNRELSAEILRRVNERKGP